jgi:hypothetical protein
VAKPADDLTTSGPLGAALYLGATLALVLTALISDGLNQRFILACCGITLGIGLGLLRIDWTRVSTWWARGVPLLSWALCLLALRLLVGGTSIQITVMAVMAIG